MQHDTRAEHRLEQLRQCMGTVYIIKDSPQLIHVSVFSMQWHCRELTVGQAYMKWIRHNLETRPNSGGERRQGRLRLWWEDYVKRNMERGGEERRIRAKNGDNWRVLIEKVLNEKWGKKKRKKKKTEGTMANLTPGDRVHEGTTHVYRDMQHVNCSKQPQRDLTLYQLIS